MTRIRGSNQGYIPQLSQNYSVPAVAGPSYNMGPTPVHAPAWGSHLGSITPQFQQMSHVPESIPSVPNVPSVPNMGTTVDLNHLIQFMHVMNMANRSGTPVQEQMVMTRGGAKSDPPAQSKN